MEKLTEMPVSRKTEFQATKKIMAIIGVFFCVHVCIAIAGAGIFASVSFSSKNILAALVDMLIVLNCCVNVIIYGIFDPKFRHIEYFKDVWREGELLCIIIMGFFQVDIRLSKLCQIKSYHILYIDYSNTEYEVFKQGIQN